MPRKKASPKAQPAPGELARLYSDLPADEQELKFEFEGLATTLAELAWNPGNRTPFSAVVRGGWGRGKTTLLRRAKRLMDETEPVEGRRRVRTLWFNAWKYPSEETVLAGLLGTLLDELHKGDLFDQMKGAVLEYRGAGVRALLKAAAPERLKPLVEVEGRFESVREKRAFHDTFRELFAQVSYVLFHGEAALRDTGGRKIDDLWNRTAQEEVTLAVFLDDLDRCRQKRVEEVLEAINLFLDLPGVCFYLGIHWERLLGALPEAVRDHGEEFLEKIVQVSFELPEVSPPDAESYIAETIAGTPLARVLEVGEGDEPGDTAVISRSLRRRHPRHIKRFLNDLSMGLAVLRNTDRLGAGDGKVPERAIVAWHLLSEVLPEDQWREIRALPQNLRPFLREWKVLEEKEGKGEAEEGEEAGEVGRLRREGLLSRHVAALAGLDERQLHALHLAAPPEVTPVRERGSRGARDLLDLDSRAWVSLDGGEFKMGSEEGSENQKPVHPVEVSGFRMSRHPVTNANYQAFVQATGKTPPEHWEDSRVPAGKENHPVVNVSWTDAEAFCTWLTKSLDGKGGGGRAALPTEAQWEFAARGVEGRKFPWGDKDPTPERANYGSSVGDTSAVGSYPDGRTPEGLEDLAGNVWEWCRDWEGTYPAERQVDPEGPEDGSSRVLRGGSSILSPGLLRGAYRLAVHPELRDIYIGFRVVWSSSGGLD